MNLCPCQSGAVYNLCCEPYHLKQKLVVTPEILMRSRYSAYVVKAIEYIHNTYAPSCRANQSLESIKNWADSVSFINLEIITAPDLTNGLVNSFTSVKQNTDEEGYVEFIASYIDNTQLCKLHERSRFIRQNQQWFYIDGKITPHTNKEIGRNEICPCGSGKKFKRCHG